MKGGFSLAQALFDLGRGFHLGDPFAQTGPYFVRTLVLGGDGEQLFEAGDFIRRRFGGAIALFCFKIFWWKVCRHDGPEFRYL